MVKTLAKPCRIGTPLAGAGPVEWLRSDAPVGYGEAVAWMDARVGAIASGEAGECIWLLQHPSLYTAGTSARDSDLLNPGRLPVHRSGRGGQYTWHGPGQRVIYVMLDLRRRGQDVRAFVCGLEDWLGAALARFGVTAGRRAGRVGLWVPRPEFGAGREDKIAAIGVRVRRWVTFHGASLNVSPDLASYAGIVPCGIRDQGVTSLADLGRPVAMEEVDAALMAAFPDTFGLPVPAGRAHPVRST